MSTNQAQPPTTQSPAASPSNSAQAQTAGPIAQQLAKLRSNGQQLPIPQQLSGQQPLSQQPQQGKRERTKTRAFFFILFLSISVLWFIGDVNSAARGQYTLLVIFPSFPLTQFILLQLMLSFFFLVISLLIIYKPGKRSLTTSIIVLSFIVFILSLALIINLWQAEWFDFIYVLLPPLVLIFVLRIRIRRWPDWVGFGEYKPPSPDKGEYQRGKTLWDWLQLLLIPILIAGGGVWFQVQQHSTDIQIAADQQQAATLKSYLDDMTDLILNHGLKTSKPDDEVRVVARAKTLTALRALDSQGRRTSIQFLYEAKLIGTQNTKAIISLTEASLNYAFLSGINLNGADLSGSYLNNSDLSLINLSGAHLGGADLSGADLSDAHLKKADLSDAHLILAQLFGADLSGANLGGADLFEVDLHVDINLKGANLSGANLSGANLSEVDLKGANLGGANLTYAQVTREQLAQAGYLKGATLPDGSKYPSQSYLILNHTERIPIPRP